MAETFKYVQGDTGPQLRLTFTDEDTGTATDLSNATVKLYFKAAGEDTIILDKTLYVNPDTAEEGIAIVTWDTGDLDVPAGAYQGEIEVTRGGPSGTKETIYEILKFKIREDFA
jgi:hypothetical protein